MGFLIGILVNAVALFVAVQAIEGLAFDGEWYQWLILGLVFGFVNAIVKPILKLLTLPITMVTLGLFLLILNALMLYLTGWLAGLVGLTFTVTGFVDAILGAIIISLVGMALNWVLGRMGVD
jgi:putative membrane protein